MLRKRSSGILLHVTSLPSKFGIGDLGPEAYRFADFLVEAGQNYWQVLPLNETNPQAGHSPYSSLSAFAGNTLVISPELLYRDGLLQKQDLAELPAFGEGPVDFDAVIASRRMLFDRAFERFRRVADKHDYEAFAWWNRRWLDDYALFVSLFQKFEKGYWFDWPPRFRDRNEEALSRARSDLRDQIDRIKFLQFEFFKQWFALEHYCFERGVGIIGDVAIYVGHNSADVWAHREIFELTRTGRLRFVAGFPGDSLNPAGQLWGNPLYDWEALKRTHYRWWMDRLRHNLLLYEIVRIDHFRGFIQYWQVPARHKTAEKGRWVRGPADDFFNAVFRHFPYPPFVTEVLGAATPDINEYLHKLQFPNVDVLLFAFDGSFAENRYYPHFHYPNSALYTSTHDTNTVRGWFETEASKAMKQRLFRYLGRDVSANRVAWELVRLAMMSVASLAIMPIQDVLSLGDEARMNRPGVATGQWRWRLRPGQITPAVVRRLAELTHTYGRA